MKTKRFLCIFLALIMILGSFPAVAATIEAEAIEIEAMSEEIVAVSEIDGPHIAAHWEIDGVQTNTMRISHVEAQQPIAFRAVLASMNGAPAIGNWNAGNVFAPWFHAGADPAELSFATGGWVRASANNAVPTIITSTFTISQELLSTITQSGDTATISVNLLANGQAGSWDPALPGTPLLVEIFYYDVVYATSVNVSPETAALQVGGVTALTHTVLPENATVQDVTWSSSDETVATVNQNGVVVGVSEGSATITVTTVDGGHTASSYITVLSVTPDLLPDRTITHGFILQHSLDLFVDGPTDYMDAFFQSTPDHLVGLDYYEDPVYGYIPVNYTARREEGLRIYWRSSDESIVTVEDYSFIGSRATLTAVGAGDATIYAFVFVNGEYFEVSTTLTVHQPDGIEIVYLAHANELPSTAAAASYFDTVRVLAIGDGELTNGQVQIIRAFPNLLELYIIGNARVPEGQNAANVNSWFRGIGWRAHAGAGEILHEYGRLQKIVIYNTEHFGNMFFRDSVVLEYVYLRHATQLGTQAFAMPQFSYSSRMHTIRLPMLENIVHRTWYYLTVLSTLELGSAAIMIERPLANAGLWFSFASNAQRMAIVWPEKDYHLTIVVPDRTAYDSFMRTEPYPGEVMPAPRLGGTVPGQGLFNDEITWLVMPFRALNEERLPVVYTADLYDDADYDWLQDLYWEDLPFSTEPLEFALNYFSLTHHLGHSNTTWRPVSDYYAYIGDNIDNLMNFQVPNWYGSGAGSITVLDLMLWAKQVGFDGVCITLYYIAGYQGRDTFIVPAGVDPIWGAPGSDGMPFAIHQAQEIRRFADLIGLEIVGVGGAGDFADPSDARRASDVERYKQFARIAHEMGAPALRVFAGNVPADYILEGWEWVMEERVVPAFLELTRYISANGWDVTLALQNHGDMVTTANQALFVHHRLAEEGVHNFGAVMDTGYFRGFGSLASNFYDWYHDIQAMLPITANFQLKKKPAGAGTSAGWLDLDRVMRDIRTSSFDAQIPIEMLWGGSGLDQDLHMSPDPNITLENRAEFVERFGRLTVGRALNETEWFLGLAQDAAERSLDSNMDILSVHGVEEIEFLTTEVRHVHVEVDPETEEETVTVRQFQAVGRGTQERPRLREVEVSASRLSAADFGVWEGAEVTLYTDETFQTAVTGDIALEDGLNVVYVSVRSANRYMYDFPRDAYGEPTWSQVPNGIGNMATERILVPEMTYYRVNVITEMAEQIRFTWLDVSHAPATTWFDLGENPSRHDYIVVLEEHDPVFAWIEITPQGDLLPISELAGIGVPTMRPWFGNVLADDRVDAGNGITLDNFYRATGATPVFLERMRLRIDVDFSAIDFGTFDPQTPYVFLEILPEPQNAAWLGGEIVPATPLLIKVFHPEYSITEIQSISIPQNQPDLDADAAETLNLTASILPIDASVTLLRWTTSDPSVATVDANGRVTAVGPGTVTITARSYENPEIYATVEITVYGEVRVTGLTLDPTEATLFVDDSASRLNLLWAENGQWQSSQPRHWVVEPTISDTIRIRYDEARTVQIVYSGENIIMMHGTHGPVFSTPLVGPQHFWNPLQASAGGNLTLTNNSAALGPIVTGQPVGYQFRVLTTTVTPTAQLTAQLDYGQEQLVELAFDVVLGDTPGQGVNWGPPGVVTTTTLNVIVYRPNEDGSVTPPQDGGNDGGENNVSGISSIMLTPTFQPSSATNQNLVFTSSDPSIARVGANGLVTGVSPGVVTITATSVQNPAVYATTTITVLASDVVPVDSVSVSPDVLRLADPNAVTAAAFDGIAPRSASFDFAWVVNGVRSTTLSITEDDLITTGPGAAHILLVREYNNSGIAMQPIGINWFANSPGANAILPWFNQAPTLPAGISFAALGNNNTTIPGVTTGPLIANNIGNFRVFVDYDALDFGTETYIEFDITVIPHQTNFNHAAWAAFTAENPVPANALTIRVYAPGEGPVNGGGNNTGGDDPIDGPSDDPIDGPGDDPIDGPGDDPIDGLPLFADATANILPANATNQNLIWSSSNLSVATVDVNGRITAVNAGVAIVTARSMQNPMAYDTITVLVGEDTELPIEVDRTELSQTIAEASERTQADYSATTWVLFLQALQNARTVYENVNATQEEIDAANTALRTAMNNLRAPSHNGPGNDGGNGGGGVVPQPPVTPDFPFADISTNHWARGYIDTVWQAGLMQGVSETRFDPNAGLTRGMMVTIIWRMAGSPAAVGAGFNDVTPGAWYADATIWAHQNGIVLGVGDGNFAPALNITREEMAVMLYRFATHRSLKLPSGNNVNFSDANTVSTWASDAVNAIAEAGVIQGRPNGTFAPLDTANRAEVAAVFARMLTIVG